MPFNKVDRPRISRSAFNLSHEYSTAFDMGQLVPCLTLEAVPGDIFNLQSELLVRLQPLVAPAFSEINASIHSFFVPYRILDDNWEDFITKGVTGEYSYTLPLWKPTHNKCGVNSLWDYFGFPLGAVSDIVKGSEPLDYVRRAYNLVYNEYYRDNNLQDEIDLGNEDVLIRAWEKDYFTAALETPQRGIAPAFPITGTTSADFTDAISSSGQLFSPKSVDWGQGTAPGAGAPFTFAIRNGNTNDEGRLLDTFNRNVIDFADAVTFDLEDLRYIAVIQQTMERSMRGGARYTEWLKAIYGTAPRDERLDRPEYIGGSKTPVIISEVLQTSQTTEGAEGSPQGNLAGHGITYSSGTNGRYRVSEFGIILSIISILPRAIYHQGMSRQWLRRTPYDFFNPGFVGLGEQEIFTAELYASVNEEKNKTIFGYQGRYNELRYMPSRVTAQLRPGHNLEQYTLARNFSDAPGLNAAFIQCKPSKRIFAAQTDPCMIVRIRHTIKAIRPLPIEAVPGIQRI